MKILLDNGHGVNTSGKRSPDGRLREYKYCREIAAEVVRQLKVRGYDAELIVTEERDIKINERCRRVNSWCNKLGSSNVVLVSIHNNAAASGGWHEARGWSGWVYTKASSKSKLLAKLLYAEAEKRGLKGNRSVPSCKYWAANFGILRNTACPAVLTENLFQDNREDVDLLLSDEGRKKIIDLHVEGIINYIKSV